MLTRLLVNTSYVINACVDDNTKKIFGKINKSHQGAC